MYRNPFFSSSNHGEPPTPPLTHTPTTNAIARVEKPPAIRRPMSPLWSIRHEFFNHAGLDARCKSRCSEAKVRRGREGYTLEESRVLSPSSDQAMAENMTTTRSSTPERYVLFQRHCGTLDSDFVRITKKRVMSIKDSVALLPEVWFHL